MTQENVELLHQAFDAVNRRDPDAFVSLMDADVEPVPILSGMEGDYYGHAGIRRWWENLLDVFPDFAAEAVEVRLSARWRQGMCVRWGAYGTEGDALEAAGLRA